jgi:chemosensory pili system protein ChpA (sensor histidine kinase/response regulator)
MADNRNYAALEWVIHEIGETLKQARHALEAYVENPRDTIRIRFCLTHIHQVRGSLQMVEFHGAALLAEEMEKLSEAMLNEQVSNASEAQEVLMRAMALYTELIERVMSQSTPEECEAVGEQMRRITEMLSSEDETA